MGSSERDQTTSHSFISYSRADEARALDVADALEQSGLRVWIDRTGISGGDEWAAAISGAIRSAGRVIVLCSNASMQSRNVRRELQLAWDRDVPILPVLLEPVTFPDSVSFFLQGVQWVELFQPDGWDRLLAVLTPGQAATESHVSATAPVKLRPARALIGRDESVSKLVEWVAQTRDRLVTIVGPGGIGKTVLATTVAAAVVPSFRDGVVFVDLAPVREPSQVITAIGQALDVGASNAMTQADRLTAMLADKQLLLILDNFEQVVEAASVLTPLLAETSTVQMLVTSRTPLRIRGEHIFRATTLLDGDDVDAAFELFITRAREADGGFEVTDTNRPAIVEICQRLDGLPLAIELAAARVRLFSPELMLSRMTRALPLLTGGARDSPERHRTLTATIDWSYQLLSPAEQALFRLLGVFSGGARFDAIETVLSVVNGSSDDLFASLDALVDWGLVRHVVGDEPRFVMLETIREFAEIKLVAAGDAPAAREAHAAWCLALAKSVELDLRNTVRQETHFRAIEADLGNVRSALRYLREIGDGSRLVRIIVALEEYMLAHPFDRESLEWLEIGFSLGVTVDDETVVIAHCIASAVAGRTGIFELGAGHMEEATRVAETNGSDYLLGRVAFEQGSRCLYQMDISPALYWFQTAIEHFRLVDAQSYVAMSLAESAEILLWLGKLESAVPMGDEAIALMRSTGDEWALGMALRKWADLSATRKRFVEAIDALTEAFAIASRVGDVRSQLGMVASTGRLAFLTGDSCSAADLLGYHVARRDEGQVVSTYPDFVMDALIDAVRQAVPTETFVECWDRGAHRSLDDGVAAALALLGELRARLADGRNGPSA